MAWYLVEMVVGWCSTRENVSIKLPAHHTRVHYDHTLMQLAIHLISPGDRGGQRGVGGRTGEEEVYAVF